jgi:small-conductance mechanosensitive channel
MDQIDPDLIDAATGLLAQLQGFLLDLAQPWRLWQVAITAGVFALAHALRWLARSRLEAWVRAQEGWPLWRLRGFVLVNQRLRGLAFVLLAWFAVWLIEDIAGPNMADVIAIAATLATAWLVVSFASRLIQNRPLRRLVAWSAWTYVTLHVLGLVESAARFLDSIALDFEEFRLSALTVLQAIMVLGFLLALARLITRATARRVERDEDISPSHRVLVVKLVQLAVFGIAFLLGLRALGFDLTAFAVLSGAIGLGIGFGLQRVVSNLVSGMIILLDKSVKPGDVISLGNTFGWINELGARYVSVLTRDGREYLIPNEDLITGQVVNWSHSDEFVRLDLEFGTSYRDDPHTVRRIAVEAARRVSRVLPDRSVACHVTGFGESSVQYVLRFWIRDASDGLASVRGAIYLALWDAFRENGITIPFPQREVKLLGGSELRMNAPE